MSESNNRAKDQKELSQQRFGKFAESYVTSQTHAKGEDLKLLFEMAAPQAEWQVLDVATGGGHTALLFAPVVAAVVATDISLKMLDAASSFIESKGYNNVSFQEAEADQLPFKESSFNLVTCRIASHHFPSCEAFIRESHRVLKPGGRLLVQDHFLPDSEEDGWSIDHFERLRDPSHNRAYSKSTWLVMCESAGFKTLKTQEVVKKHELIPWADRQGCSEEIKKELLRQLKTTSKVVQEWMQPRDLEGDNPSFVNHHLLILAEKQ